MPVSTGLQKYFDSQKKKKGATQDKLDALLPNIDPAFAASFEAFRGRVLDIVEETPEAESMVLEELDDLNQKVSHGKRQHNLKKASVIIDAAT